MSTVEKCKIGGQKMEYSLNHVTYC